MFIPEEINNLLIGEKFKIDDIGMSGSSIYIYENKVLKIQDNSKESQNEYQMLQYLKGKVPVPTIYIHKIINQKLYLLISKCDGDMTCSQYYMDNPSLLCKILADGLRKLWRIDISDCPSNQTLSQKLINAEYNIKNGLVDMDNVNPETFGENGFKNPTELLKWLYENKPEEELVFSHGDYSLPNIFGIHDKVSGYIDLGRAGIADKWCDIAICYRSLMDKLNGKYESKKNATHSDFDETLLFRELDIEPDWRKIKYYILLDELF